MPLDTPHKCDWILDDPEGARPPSWSRLSRAGRPVYADLRSTAGRDPEKTTRTALARPKGVGAARGFGSGLGWDLVLGRVQHRVRAQTSASRLAVTAHGCPSAPRRGGHHRGRTGRRKADDHLPVLRRSAVLGEARREFGIEPKLVPQGRLAADRLAQAIRLATTDGSTRRRVATLGEKVRAEQGVARAVRVITNEQQRDGMCYSRVPWRRP